MALIINFKLSVRPKSLDNNKTNRSLKQAFPSQSRTHCLNHIIDNLWTRRTRRLFRTLVNLFKFMNRNHKGWLQVLATYPNFWTAITPCKAISSRIGPIQLLISLNLHHIFRSQASTPKCLMLLRSLGFSSSNSNHNWRYCGIMRSHHTLELKIW